MNPSRLLNIRSLLFWGCLALQSCVSTEKVQSEKFVVILKDLTLSTDSQQNSYNDGIISSILQSLVPRDEVYGLGITSMSYTRPQVLIHTVFPDDPQPIKTKFLKARKNLLAKWWSIAAVQRPAHPRTDIVGAINHAANLFNGQRGRKWLIITSDMMQSSKILDLESVTEIQVESALAILKQANYVPNLSGVKVAVIGTGNGKTPAYYQSLEKFWRAFFTAADADVVAFRSDYSWKHFTD